MCLFFQSEIMYLVHHVLCDGICSSWDNVQWKSSLCLRLTLKSVHFVDLQGITGTSLRDSLTSHGHSDVLGKEVKMGPMQLPPEAWEAVRILKDKIQTVPVLVFPYFNKPFCLRWMHPRKGWVRCCLRSKTTGVATPSHLGAAHSHHPRRTTIVPNSFLDLKWSHQALQGVSRAHAICSAN